MRRIVFQIIFSVLCLSVQAQKVSNIRAEQRGQDIVVLYSLETASPCEVSLLLSHDNGMTWSSALKNVSGDVGKNIAAGEKQITWKVLEERDQLVGDKIKFKLVVSKIEKILNKEEMAQRQRKKKIRGRDVANVIYIGAIVALMIWSNKVYGN